MKAFLLPLSIVCGLSVAAALYGDAATTAPARSDKDPMGWSPSTEPPPLRQPLNGDAYTRAFADALKNLNRQDLAAGPPFGVVLVDVDQDSVAESLGLAPDDVFVALEGEPLHGGLDFVARRDAAKDTQMARVWSAANKELKLVSLPVGKLGIRSREYWRLDRRYVQTLPKGQLPSDEMLVATQCFAALPDVAESALANAKSDGEHRPMLDATAAMIALNDYRYDDSLAFAEAAMKEDPQYAWAMAEIARNCAIHDFRWKLAVDLVNQFPHCINDAQEQAGTEQMMEDAIREFEQLPADEMPNPVQAFSTLPFASHKLDFKLFDVDPPDALKQFSQELQKKGKLSFNVPDGHYYDLCIGPGAANADLGVTCRLRATDKIQSEWGKLIELELLDSQSKKRILGLWIYYNFEVQIRLGDQEFLTMDLSKELAAKKPFTIRMSAVGNRMEIDLNDRRIFYGPLLADETARQLAVHAHFQGMSGSLADVAWRTAGPGGH